MKTLLYKACLFIIFIVCSFTAFAQSDSLKIDSLKKVLAIEKEDTNKVITLNNMGEVLYSNSKLKEALQYEMKALDLAKKINFTRRIGYYYWIIGGILSIMDNRLEAIQYYYNALQIYQARNDRYSSGVILWNIGFQQTFLKNYNEAYDAYSKSLSLLQQADSINNSIGALCYIYLAKIFIIRHALDKAEEYNSTGLKISKAVKDVIAQANAYSTAGDIILQQIQKENIVSNHKVLLESAKENYSQSLHDFKASIDTGGMGDGYTNLAYVDIQLNNLTEAQKYSDSALFCAKEINFKDDFREAYWVQYQIDSAKGNFQAAFANHKKYILYLDSIVNDENVKKSLQSSMQYEFDKKQAVAKATQDKKDADAKRIKNQQYFAIAALGIVVLAVIIFTFIQFRNNKHKKKANLLLERQNQKVETTLSELKSTQAQLIQSEKMASLGELTAGIAHEIQNPLNFVNNFSEVNQEMIDELITEVDKKNYDEVKLIATDIKENEEKINHHGKRADAIVKNMLQHSRTTKGIKEPTDINALCDEYLRLSYHGLRAKDKTFNADMKTDFDETIGNINIIPQDIGRVLLNLFNNAFYAVAEKKKQQPDYEPAVSVSTNKIDDKVEIKVTDNGNGIPQNMVDKIFQPFFTTKPTGEGTGLGLSLSYDIIKAHGGEIKVKTKEGEGSEFIILLPVV
jgi:two-component system NtrC family sensor kinase